MFYVFYVVGTDFMKCCNKLNKDCKKRCQNPFGIQQLLVRKPPGSGNCKLTTQQMADV